MSDKTLLDAKRSHHQMMKEMLTKIDIPVIDHIALEMASKRRFLKNSMPEHFTANYVNVGIILGLVLTLFSWIFAGSVWIAALIVGSSYVLLHKRMLWLMDRYYFLSKTPKFKRLMSESAKGLYTRNIDESGYDERFLKPVLLRYFTDGEITGLEFWNVTVEMGYAFRSEFHDTRMDINEVDDWFINGKIDALIPEPVDEDIKEYAQEKPPIPKKKALSEKSKEFDKGEEIQSETPRTENPSKTEVAGSPQISEAIDQGSNRGSQSTPTAESEDEATSNEAAMEAKQNHNDEVSGKDTSLMEGEESKSEKKTQSEDADVSVDSLEGNHEDASQEEEVSNIDFDSIEGDDFDPEDDEFGFDEFTSAFEPDEGDDDNSDMDIYDAISSEVIAEEEK